MSRVIVKGLPVYLTDDKLKEHFIKRLTHKHNNSNSQNLITDVKILKDKNGNSRRFAFIGFRNEDDAYDAVDYFNGSYIDTAKLNVSIAKSFADPNVPQPMKEKKREALKRIREREEKLIGGKNKKQKSKHDNKKVSSIDAEIEKNKQLQEFIETMKPSSKVPSWEKVTSTAESNPLLDELTVDNSNSESSTSNPLLSQALAMKSDNDSDDEYIDFQSKPEKNEKSNEQIMLLDSLEKSQKNSDDGDDDDDELSNEIAKDEAVSDLDWLKQRRVRIRNGENVPVKVDLDNDTQKEITHSEEAEEQTSKKTDEEIAIEKISATGRLFLRNILYTSTENDFKKLFSSFGEIDEVHVALDTRTGKSKGFAYVLFKNPADAVQAYIELDKQIFQGRLLHILPADSKKNHRLDEFDLKNMPLKKQKELRRKDNATKHTFSWNSLYMNQDAVLSSVASSLGLEKSQLLDPENSNSAVKQALAEAHVIGDVRKYFESKGVDLTKFSQMRSANDKDDTVILVKNFPFGTTREELGDLFLPFGKLTRFLMPNVGTIAIIQYRDITSGRAAFTKLAYKRFKDGIIYLEKGPKNLFTREPSSDESLESEEKSEVEAKEVKLSSHDIMEKREESSEKRTDDDGDEDIVDGPTVSIFIKNLNFTTTTSQLVERFKSFGGFVVAQVKTKPDPKDSQRTLSMGFGFVEFRTKEQALAVIEAMDGSVIDGHKIQMKLSHRQGTNNNSNNAKDKKKKSSKIIVKNLPFEATRKDIFELFSSFGQLKSVRVPKKFDKSARGFAFVEFLLPKEAENAMDQLQGVHLLGRRLVMQYAEQDAVNAEEEIERMTKKVRKQAATREYAQIKNDGGRKRIEIEEGENDEFGGM
ncbi:hypothetical protein TBLA_0C02300 [Henningerozyma blattae CBS 6284]|uniref:Multiple RNA-binding domain-containing protein 1 n=1 Tax=Henningerozyma blattae (strain ATCC 34711 / CBS 6284 / DSM 70876 / NBRC 10599 / NRRL Y-10934 / UCD 77-7) TaxID=1071380 RepID=I2H0Y9_HENB6|nr:hypothetical protein TBLA_0C02300 [Tetrapisispora blattae CBS 6284]CCH60041.1 hypothetical protein TBLA_0C02300 [Tetrapisispora blattae CBS 6284]